MSQDETDPSNEDKQLAAQNQETHRHECEVRDVVARYRKALKNLEKRPNRKELAAGVVESYLLAVEKNRGADSAVRLRQDCRTLMQQERTKQK